MRVLHIVATPRGLASNTARLSGVLIEELLEKHPGLSIQTLDLFTASLPAIAGSNIESKYTLMTGQNLDDAGAQSWRQIEATIAQFLEADAYILTTPMWNLSIPYALKYYIDCIVQPGYLFRYDEMGRTVGMVQGKKMICVTSSGGDYSNEPLLSYDFVEPYLRTIFGFVGLTDIHFLKVQPMDISPEVRNAALKVAMAEARNFVAQSDWGAGIAEETERALRA